MIQVRTAKGNIDLYLYTEGVVDGWMGKWVGNQLRIHGVVNICYHRGVQLGGISEGRASGFSLA